MQQTALQPAPSKSPKPAAKATAGATVRRAAPVPSLWSLLTLSPSSPADEREADVAEADVRSLDASRRRAWLADAATTTSGSGQPVEDAVSVDAGPQAQQVADAIDARAFTVGSRICLGPGYVPDTPVGDALLAHELTHARQQRSGPARLAASPKSPTSKQLKTFCATDWIHCGQLKPKSFRLVGAHLSKEPRPPTMPQAGLSEGSARVFVEVPKAFATGYVNVYLVGPDGTPIRGGVGVLWAGSQEPENEVEVDRRAAEAVGADTRAMLVDGDPSYAGHKRLTGQPIRVIEVTQLGHSVLARLDAGNAEGAMNVFYARLVFDEPSGGRVEYRATYGNRGGSSYRDFVIDDRSAVQRIGNLTQAVSQGSAFGTLVFDDDAKDKRK